MKKLSVSIKTYIRERLEAKKSDLDITGWLDSAAKRARQIFVATHVLKYTHVDAKGTNIYAKQEIVLQNESTSYISTASISKAVNDAVGNAAALDVAGLLQLEDSGITLLDLIAKGDSSPLAPFADSQIQLDTWMNGFKDVLKNNDLSSHTLAKQVYFPVEDQYHLLAPLYASSVSHALYERITESLFSEVVKIARDRRRNGKYSDVVIVDYPKLAVQKFGGTKPQNVSKLNSARRGKSYLLSSVPPIWESIEKPPLKNDVFWGIYKKRIADLISDFKCFLTYNKRKTKEERELRKKYINDLMDVLIQTAAEIQTMNTGWSKASEIALHEKVWLDPGCEDKEFIILRDQKIWQKEVAKRFARFMSSQLESDELLFSDTELNEFQSICVRHLLAVEV